MKLKAKLPKQELLLCNKEVSINLRILKAKQRFQLKYCSEMEGNKYADTLWVDHETKCLIYLSEALQTKKKRKEKACNTFWVLRHLLATIILNDEMLR